MPKHYFQKGNTYSKGHGRPKGALNKIDADFKKAFEQAFLKMGGWLGLYKWGVENPNLFYPLLARMIPAKATIDVDVGMKHEDWVRKIQEFHRNNNMIEHEEGAVIESKQVAAIPSQAEYSGETVNIETKADNEKEVCRSGSA